MKNFACVFVMIFTMASIFAQNCTITFEATGLTNHIDSVKIENITRGTFLTLDGGDTLLLSGTNNVNESGTFNNVLLVFPNPMKSYATVSFYIKKTEYVNLRISDESGREIIMLNKELHEGNQNFRIKGLMQGLYFIHIAGDNSFYQAKLICLGSGKGKAEIEHDVSQKMIGANIKGLKSYTPMYFVSGDSIRFTGYSGMYSDVISKVVTSGQSIAFLFASPPTITTDTVSSVTHISSVCGGDVTNDGGAAVSARGVCWSTSHNPEITNRHTSNGTGTGNFISSIDSLITNTLFYVRAYATNCKGISYGAEVNFRTALLHCGTVNDIDGNTYNTVLIGTQCWMSENLKTSKYKNGTSITNIINTSVWAADTTGAWCYLYNDSVNYSFYGKLYSWYATHNSNGICPSGWHIPSYVEWATLTDYLTNNGYGYEGSGNDIAKSLSSASGWASYSVPGTPGHDQASNNSSGFNGLPASTFDGSNLVFDPTGTYTRWWSEEYPLNPIFGFSFTIEHEVDNFATVILLKRGGLSVRCIRD